MRVLNVTTSVLLSATVALIIGCSKSEESPAAPPAPAASAPAEAPKPAEVQKAAETAVDTANAEASKLLDQAKSLISDQKYTDAADLLKRLSDMKLTPEQQKLLDDLKAQVQKALTSASGAASDAANKASEAVGGALGK